MKHSLRMAASALAFALLAASAVPFAAADDTSAGARAEPTKLVVSVYYKTDAGKSPLAGVEVFALVGGVPMYRCTNANGKAVFDNLIWGSTVSVLATGPSVNTPKCANRDFLNPDNGKQMFAVFFKNHQGVRITDPIVLDTWRQAVKLVAKTPYNQRRICFGFKVTILGTRGDDVLLGTVGPDYVNLRGGDDTFSALNGDDVVCGGPGDDVIYGGYDSDFLIGGGGADTLHGNAPENLINPADFDTLFGGPGMDTCIMGHNTDSCEK